MVSDKQLLANRQNAPNGGVKTLEGKAIVRLNAVKFGWLCRDLLLPGEDAELLWEIRESFMADLKPEGAVEQMLVEFIVSGLWKLMRGRSMETAYIENTLNYCQRAFKTPDDTALWRFGQIRTGKQQPVAESIPKIRVCYRKADLQSAS
jgi:hypothetical protein